MSMCRFCNEAQHSFLLLILQMQDKFIGSSRDATIYVTIRLKFRLFFGCGASARPTRCTASARRECFVLHHLMQNESTEHHSLCLFVEDWPLTGVISMLTIAGPRLNAPKFTRIQNQSHVKMTDFCCLKFSCDSSARFSLPINPIFSFLSHNGIRTPSRYCGTEFSSTVCGAFCFLSGW